MKNWTREEPSGERPRRDSRQPPGSLSPPRRSPLPDWHSRLPFRASSRVGYRSDGGFLRHPSFPLSHSTAVVPALGDAFLPSAPMRRSCLFRTILHVVVGEKKEEDAMATRWNLWGQPMGLMWCGGRGKNAVLPHQPDALTAPVRGDRLRLFFFSSSFFPLQGLLWGAVGSFGRPRRHC